jgi:lipoprotein signal peptidase
VDLAVLVVLALAALVLPDLAARHARPAVLNLGPNDLDYVRGFREDWERDRLTRFHWTTPHATVRLPIMARGDGLRLTMRIRRHLVDPAKVTIRAEERIVSVFDIQADPRIAYRTIAVDLPPLEGRAPFGLAIDSTSVDPRPLGIAIDWMQLERTGPSGRFVLLGATRLALLLLAIAAFVAPRLAGASLRAAAAHAFALTALMAAGCAWDVLAAERIAREGCIVYTAVAVIAVMVARWRRTRDALEIADATVAGALVLIVLGALVLRLAILLHPQFYYPDVRVHALFAWQLARRGLIGFLRHFTEDQFRFSLGLQMENGHWYAFPYPPAFYMLCWPLVTFARMRPEVAVSVLAAAVNSLEAFVVYGIARRLRAAVWTGVAAAAAHALLPLFLARLSLAYFPAMVGHAVDAIVILYLLARLREMDRPRAVVTLGALIALALLTYTQSLLNFAVLMPLFLVVLIARDRSAETRRCAIGLVIAGALGAVLSLVVFYGRYVPTFIDMQRGVPMAEERILLEKPSTPVPADELAPQEPDDPFAGPTVNPWRGVRKAAWRLYVFYGLFALAVVAGLALVGRAQASWPYAAFVLAWAATYLALNLLSAGLPGPNLVRYNKDLEVVAPLFCLALAGVGEWLWTRSRWLAILYAGSYGAFALTRAVHYLTEKFILER